MLCLKKKGHTATKCWNLEGELLEQKKAGKPICNKCDNKGGDPHYTTNCPQLKKPKAEAKAVAKAVTAKIANLEIETNGDKGPPSCSSDSYLDADDVDDDWLDDDLLE